VVQKEEDVAHMEKNLDQEEEEDLAQLEGDIGLLGGGGVLWMVKDYMLLVEEDMALVEDDVDLLRENMAQVKEHTEEELFQAED
jgi:hypothetical protein